MRAVLLAAATTLSPTRVAEIATTLRASAGEDLAIELFSWRPVETHAGLQVTVLGPPAGRTPPTGVAANPAPPRDRTAGATGAVRPRPGAGSTHWAVRVRRSRLYQAVRRLVRGGISRQFAAAVRRHPAVLPAARDSRLVVALDSGTIAAAWWLSRRLPDPAVVYGLAAAERELGPALTWADAR